jgi:hypothetical protein
MIHGRVDVNADAGKASGTADAVPFLEDSRFQSSAIPITLEVLLVAIDQFRYLIDDPHSNEALFSVNHQFHDAISARDRRRMDAAISAFWNDVRAEGIAELTRLGFTERSQVKNQDDVIYPLTQETALTIEALTLRRVKEANLRKHFDIYRDDQLKSEYIMTNIRLGPKERRESTLGGAMIPFLVSKLEQYIGALIRIGLALHHQGLGELPAIPNSVYERYKTNLDSSDIVRWQIDKKVLDFLQGSPDNWLKSINRWTKIDIGSVGGDWNKIKELIQRRHALVHNTGLVDEEYFTKVGHSLVQQQLHIGDELICDRHYVLSVLTELETWSTCISLHWAKHFFPKWSIFYPDVIGRVVGLESKANWAHALLILDAFLAQPAPNDPEKVALAHINRWFCMQELGRSNKELAESITTWQPEHLDPNSVDSLRVEAGRAALLRDYNALARVVRRGLTSNEPSFQKKSLREMPLMKRAMDESSMIRALMMGVERNPTRTRRPQRR